MKRNLVSFSVLAGFSMLAFSALGETAPAVTSDKTVAVQPGTNAQAVAERKAKEARLLAVQEEITALRKQDAQLRDSLRKQFTELESSLTNVNSQDQEYLTLKDELKQAEAKVIELRAKLKQKTDSMPEFKNASDKMSALKAQMQDSSRKMTELLKEKSRLNSEIFAAMQKDQPPVKAKEIPPVQKPAGQPTVAAPAPGK